jgi:hypothetical protein
VLTRHVSHIGKERHTMWGASPFYITCIKKNVYRIFSMKCSLCQHTTGTQQAWHKKHCMEHKMCDIFEALRLSWV